MFDAENEDEQHQLLLRALHHQHAERKVVADEKQTPEPLPVTIRDVDPALRLGLELGRQVTWRDAAQFHSVSFDDVEFWGDVSCENRLFSGETSFAGAAFFQMPKFHGATLHPDTSFNDTHRFETSFAPAWGERRPLEVHKRRHKDRIARANRRLESARKKARTLRAGKSGSATEQKAYKEADDAVTEISSAIRTLEKREALRTPSLVKAAADYEESYGEYLKNPTDNKQRAADFERAYRRLKNLMEENRARNEENLFFTLEIQSRIKRVGDKEVSVFERWVGRCYGLISDYGRSIRRPLVAIGVSSVLFSLLMDIAQEKGSSVEAALGFILKNMLPVFLVRDQLSLEGANGVVLALSTIYILVNAILWFLFALAVRRKFQIN